MAPSAVEAESAPIRSKTERYSEPLKLSGALDSFESFDVTPIIGREFPSAKLVDWLNAENADDLIRDLAITSMWARSRFSTAKADLLQYRSEVLSFSEHRMVSPTTFRNNSSYALVSSPVDQRPRVSTFIPF
jgi:hypothetical protein